MAEFEEAGMPIHRVEEEQLSPILCPYVLAIGVPSFIDTDGRRWVDELWYKDLREHLVYIKSLILAAPRREGPIPPHARCLDDDPDFDRVRFVDLVPSNSLLAGLFNWPRNLARLWRAVAGAEIVHTGLADWPIPTGWSATVIAKLRRKILLIVVESAFWRASRSASLLRRMRGWIWEHVNRMCLRQASLALFTHQGYLDDLLPDGNRAEVLPASWIDAKDVLPQASAELCWDKKASEKRLSFLFAGRLVAEKGVMDLLQAAADLPSTISLDIIGSGDLVSSVRQIAEANGAVRLLEPVEYGPDFFDLLRRYHAVIVPSRTDEQPRIIFDAYSQAVPVLATETKGNSECILHEQSGYLVPPGDVGALQATMCRAGRDVTTLRRLGMRGLILARAYTHQEMHRRRWEMLRRLLDNNSSPSSF